VNRLRQLRSRRGLDAIKQNTGGKHQRKEAMNVSSTDKGTLYSARGSRKRKDRVGCMGENGPSWNRRREEKISADAGGGTDTHSPYEKGTGTILVMVCTVQEWYACSGGQKRAAHETSWGKIRETRKRLWKERPIKYRTGGTSQF